MTNSNENSSQPDEAFLANREALKEVIEDTRDSIAESYAFWKSQGRKVRPDILWREVESGSDLEIAATLYVMKLVEADKSIPRYDNPTQAEMQEILERAASYEGDWYHSIVKLEMSDDWTPLHQAIDDLPYSAGVSLSVSFAHDASMFKYFGLDVEGDE